MKRSEGVGNIEEVTGEQHDWRNLALMQAARLGCPFQVSVHKCPERGKQAGGISSLCMLAELLRVTKTWWDSSHNGVLPWIDGWIQAGKEGQHMQRRGGSAQCFALEWVQSLLST